MEGSDPAYRAWSRKSRASGTGVLGGACRGFRLRLCCEYILDWQQKREKKGDELTNAGASHTDARRSTETSREEQRERRHSRMKDDPHG